MTPVDPDDLTPWLDRFERSGALGRAVLLSSGAVRLAAGLIDRTLDRAATIVVDSQDAFRKELDPNVSDARILEETHERSQP